MCWVITRVFSSSSGYRRILGNSFKIKKGESPLFVVLPDTIGDETLGTQLL